MACRRCGVSNEDARATVRGVIAARETGEVRDAAELLWQFHQDAEREGVPVDHAWTELFTAAAVISHHLLGQLAKEREQEFGDALLQLAAESL